MKTIGKILSTLGILAMLPFAFSSCERSFDGPPFTAPKYTGDPANITIAALKDMYAHVADANNSYEVIETALIIEGYVTGNDISGNIYKALYIQDATGAISLSVDANSLAALFPVGGKVVVHLHELAMVRYGGQLQIGYPGGTPPRIPELIFNEVIFRDGFASDNNAIPIVKTIAELDPAKDVNKLIQLDKVYFENRGTGQFAPGTGSENQTLIDAEGKTIILRSSNFSTFAKDYLPDGSGTVVAILGRYGTDEQTSVWQLVIRDLDDLINFGQPIPEKPDTGDVMNETFGTGTHASGNRPKIAEFTGWDMTTLTYSDASGNADIRTVGGYTEGAHVWFPAKDTYLTVSGINTSGKQNLKLSFQLSANLYNAVDAMNLNAMTVKFNGTAYTIPSTPVSNANGDNNKIYTFAFDIPAVADAVLEFYAAAADNTLGLRLDNIRIYVDDSNQLEP